MKLVKFTISLLCSIALFTACTKTDDNTDNNSSNTPTPAPTKKELLIAGKWQLTAKVATTKHNGKDTSANLYTDLKDCEKDDFIQFADNGAVTKDENTVVCTGNPQTVAFTYKLMDNDTRIAIYDSNPDTLDLTEVTASQLKLSLTWKNSSNNDVTTVETYKNIK